MATKKLVKWDEQLAKDATIAAKMEESTAGGQFFSLRGGVLTWQDAPLPKNQMAVVIIDSVLENVFYEGKFDPDKLQSPTCFAFGRNEADMKPHKIVFEQGNEQNAQCDGCSKNEWGSADVGRGKACSNVRRLALIPAGHFNSAGKFELIEDAEHYRTTPVGFMKIPVTSVKGYASFVKQVAGALKRPPHGIVTRIYIAPDAKTQFKVMFETLDNLPGDLIPTIMKRNEEVKATIDFPYQAMEEDATPKKTGSKAAKQPRKTSRKY